MSRPDFVWHFVLVRTGQAIERGERLATLSLTAAEVGRIGLPELRRAIDAERRIWARRAIDAGYVDGYGVSVHSERGYRRSIFPVAAAIVPAATVPPEA